MSYDLTDSAIARQNVLNNPYALSQLEQHLGMVGFQFEGEMLFTRVQVSRLLDVDIRTIERYIALYEQELTQNGYKIFKGKALKKLKLLYVSDTSVGDIIDPKVPSLAMFTFRALLNLAMLITESERARALRSRMLDIVLDVMAEKAGGHTRFINQRDEDFLPAAYAEENYRKQFTDALHHYLDMDKTKYAVYTNKIYQAIFYEDAKEYREILRLEEKDKTRDTMYTEVLNAIASFENGLAEQMGAQYAQLGRRLKPDELDALIVKAAANPFMKPILENARVRMASRDLCFRDALHNKLSHYIQTIPQGDFERFLGEKSKSLEERLSDPEMLAVLKRLKNR